MTCYFKKLTENGKFSASKFKSLMDSLLCAGAGVLNCPQIIDTPTAQRIFWRCFYACDKSVYPWIMPGIYLFGHEGRIMYIGKTSKALKIRLKGRYFGPDYDDGDRAMPQFHIASKCKDSLLAEEGIGGFKKDFKDEYDKILEHHSEIRIKNARHFAAAGMDGVWFALLPVSEEKAGEIEDLEHDMIKQAKLCRHKLINEKQ